ncbi:MAG: DNA repair protein RecN [Gammaproteobacteria bacterium]|nr:DNA repair protein RecN [Gammaproteobacteria bacterium]MAY02700.1 DNA repair protein RecN [Gammaproteobacteria bacterium]
MLSQLTIKHYAIVEQLDLELQNGMTVITGETGAGKSIMLDALSLTLGDRADKEVIQPGQDKAEISASFIISDNPDAQDWLREQDYEADDSCILRRIVTAEGRSKAYINGHPVTLNELKQLGDMLVDIHSQHEHQSLLKTATHQRLLDDYCETRKLAAQVAEKAQAWRALNDELEELQSQAEEHNARFELQQYQLRELDELNLGDAEYPELEAEHQQLSHAETILNTLQSALDICRDNDSQNLQSAIAQVIGLLDDLPYRSKQVESAYELLNTAMIQLEEAGSELNHAADAMEINPGRLQEVDERLSAVHQLARKHRVKPDELAGFHQELKEQLGSVSSADEQLEKLQQQLDALAQEYQKLADSLSDKRKKGAKALSEAVNRQLHKLDMNTASFSVALQENSGPRLSGKGNESIEFLVSTNPGQSPKALIKIASGGELSRISLAIQVVTAQTSAIPSLIFDEVDVGIGGTVALSVGELLRQLGDKGQVLCVTHQAQVASQGHQHLYVSKAAGKSAISTRVEALTGEDKVTEIARMLGGNADNESSMAHARQMMAS